MKKQSVSWPEKKTREEWHGKIQQFMDVDMTKSDIYKDLTNSFITWKKPLQDKLSILDLPKLHTLTDNEKFHLLSVFFSSHDQKTNDIYFDRANNLVTPSWINYINELLNNAVDYYQDYLLRSIWTAFVQKWNRKKSNLPKISFKDTKDILDFIDATTSEKNSKADRQIDCSLLKISVWLHEYKEHEKEISQAESKFKEIKEDNFFPYFYDDKWKEIDYDIYKKCFETPWDCDYVQLQTKSWLSNKPTIFFNSSWRIKDPNKIVLKLLANRKYDSIDTIKDIYGIRNEVKTKEDALFLLEYLRLHIFNKTWNIVDKNIFVTNNNQTEIESLNESVDFVNRHRNNLDEEFYNYLTNYYEKEIIKIQEKMTKTSEKKISKNSKDYNAKDYHDIKILWKLWWKNVEVQINMVNSKNDRWYSHHYLYDAKTKIQALVRLQWYISESLIKRYIKQAIDKNILEDWSIGKKPELLTLGWFKWDYKKISIEEKNAVIQKFFNHFLLDPNEKFFFKLDIPGKQHNQIYTTKDNRNSYHYDEEYKKIYPDGAQIQNAWERTNKKI